ncbi:MAG TPA: class I SAM-dependent methyltransferase [Vicinamibacterales bacterium]
MSTPPERKDSAPAGSDGYEAVAEQFIARRDPWIGVPEVLAWARGMPQGRAILDLGCGHGVPIGRALAHAGYRVHGVDASPALVAAFRANVPGATAEIARIEAFDVSRAIHDGVVAWGVLFFLSPAGQERVIANVAAALRADGPGRFLFTAPRDAFSWDDVLNGATCVSLGFERYREVLEQHGFSLQRTYLDSADNHYFESVRRPS